MNEVKDVMTRTVQTIEPSATLAQTAARMRELGVGVLPVVDDGRVVGMITDRDITVRATAKGLDPSQAMVHDAMSPGVIHCYLDQPLKEAAGLMEKYRVRRLPVLNRENQLVGIVSLDDLAVDTGDRELAGEVLGNVARRQVPRVPTYKHIVVPLDGSSSAEQILPYVEPLAEHFGSRITLLRAVTPLEGYVAQYGEVGTRAQAEGPSVSTIAPISKDTRANALEYLTQIQARLQGKGIAVDCEYPEEPAATAIVQRARHLGADLIAMATHGRGGIDRAIHGSVADEVLRQAPCAVLVARANHNT